MNIKEYNLKIDVNENSVIEFIYRGNENIIINSYDNGTLVKTLIPRYVIEKFVELING